jgi:hypothetical protein
VRRGLRKYDAGRSAGSTDALVHMARREASVAAPPPPAAPGIGNMAHRGSGRKVTSRDNLKWNPFSQSFRSDAPAGR